MRRYPLAPLAALAGLEVHQLSSKLRLSGSNWKQYRDLGVSEKVADRLARKLGFAAYNVWPEMIDHAIEDASTPCAECEEPFLPVRKGHTFCSKRCWNRQKERARYWSDPEVRARKIESVRAYRAECGGYERARKRQAYWADPEAARAKLREGRQRRKEARERTDA